MLSVPADEPSSLHRHAGAPRLIEWTGERCVPWAPDVQVVYEHLHRYLWAAGLVAGRRVLDLASGEGFGAAILAQSAGSVVGADIDERSVEHSRLNYGASNLTFELADARDLSAFDDDSFGAVVAFEMIEHVAEHDHLLDEIQRVLQPEGLLIISTPDREAYDEASGENPFHVHELGADEFVALLRSRFANTAAWGQRTITGSALAALGGSPSAEGPAAQSFFIERAEEEWRVASGLSPLYIVALASNAELPRVASESTLADSGLGLIEGVRRQFLGELDAQRQEVALELARIRARAVHDSHTIASLDAQLNAARHQLLRIEGSVTWQLFQRVRARAFAVLGGEGSSGVDVLQGTLRGVGRRLRASRNGSLPSATNALRRKSRRALSEPIELPESEHPDVSIVIPLYAHAELTHAALDSIRENTPHVSFEVILVDDAADRQTKVLLEKVHGARVIVNETNIGYLRSVQRGAGAARGRWLVLCNNDIEVQPGWLAALLDCAESAPDIAIVAPKFLYPDGSLAEAGAITWRDGTGVNYGRGGDPAGCHYEYRREIDYGSAAALMVKADFWRDAGGFDERFLPMYYEDTDLCFEARERGFRVMFEPRSQVIHVEGATAGVDAGAGHKRHQERNRPKFVEKWHDCLERDHLPSDERPLWMAANLRSERRVLVVDHRVPTWDRDSGSLRMVGMIGALIELGCQVVFLPDNLLARQPYTRELQRMGVEVVYGMNGTVALTEIGPSLSHVILSRPEAASRWLDLVREHAPAATVVYDTVDLHWLREARRAATDAERGADGIVLTPKATSMRELELGLIRATDATLVVTDSERARVQADVPDAVVHVLPNVNELRVRVPPADAREGVLFIGGFEHTPNVDATLTLVQDVMPLVWRELAQTRVTIVGPDPPPEVQALSSPLVDIKGWVQDLDPLLSSSRVLVAPLTYGAGLKGKVTQALAAGLPVVTTPIGAEGLDAVDGEQLLIGESASELAERVIRVLRDERLWQHLSSSGQRLAAEHCSPAVMAERLGALMRDDRASRRPADRVSVQVR